MRNLFFLLILCVVLAAPAVSPAGQVQLFKPLEQGMSAMQLRAQAQAEGFAQAVAEEAQVMLAGGLNEERAALLKEYYVDHAKPYIQGYKIQSSQAFEDGLSLTMDVLVDRRALREGLTEMGLFATTKTLQPASVTWPQNITEADLLALRRLVILTGLDLVEGASPALVLEYGSEKGTYKARLQNEGQEWLGVNKDLASAWFSVWKNWFTRPKATNSMDGGQYLIISGWFTPDGALEFDRVLQGWDTAVQQSELVSLDMQSTGVGATWKVNVLNRGRLDMLLNSFLPQRGLTFHLTEGAK